MRASRLLRARVRPDGNSRRRGMAIIVDLRPDEVVSYGLCLNCQLEFAYTYRKVDEIKTVQRGKIAAAWSW